MLRLWNRLTSVRTKARSWSWLAVFSILFGICLQATTYAGEDDRRRYDRAGDRWRDDGRREYDRGDHDRHRHDRSDWRRGRDHDHRDGGKRIDVDIGIGRGRPEYETREVRVWVPPVYRTVVDRRWVEPVYRTEVERVWVPERVEERLVRHRHKGHWHRRLERVVVEPGHYETVERHVCVREGHWETFERQELVCDGHYDVRREPVRRPYRVSPFEVVNPALSRLGVGGL